MQPWRWPKSTMGTLLPFPTSWYTAIGGPKAFWASSLSVCCFAVEPMASCSIVHALFGMLPLSIRATVLSSFLLPSTLPPFFLFDSGWEPPSMQRLSLLTSVSHMLAHKASASLRRLSNALQLPSHPAQYFGLESLMPHGTTLTDFVLNFGPWSTARTYQAISMYERETIDLTLLYQVDIQRPDSGCGGVEIQINDDSA